MLEVTPDTEAIVGDFLRTHAAITPLVGDRISGSTPKTLSDPWIRITQIDDAPLESSTTLRLVAVYLQIECYGSDNRSQAQAEASLLARTTRAVLNTMPQADVAGAVISAVKPGSIKRLPDTELEINRERFIFDATVWLHA